jgi:hypothetical protein
MIQKSPSTTGGLLMAAALLCLVLWAAPGSGSKANTAPTREPAVSSVQTPAPATDGAAQNARDDKH